MFDLPHALAGQADVLADFFQRHRVAAAKAVAELQNLGRSGVDVIEQLLELPQLIVPQTCSSGPGLLRVGHHFVDRQFRITVPPLNWVGE